MEQNTYEKEVDLKDLMFAILRKWRGIIVTAIVLAVILGGYKMTASVQQNHDRTYLAEQNEKYENDLEIYNTQKSALEQEVENLSASIEEVDTYLEKSILMQISPYNKVVASAEVYIDAEKENAAGLVGVYSSIVKQEAILEEIANELGVEPRYIQELISVDSSAQGFVVVEKDDANTAVGTGKSTYYTENVNMLKIKVAYTDTDTAELILEAILGELEKCKDDLSTQIGSHTLEIMNQGTASLVDMDLASKQKTFTDSKTSLNATLKAKQDELLKLQEPKIPNVSSAGALKQGIKYGILGGTLGCFMAVFFICMIFLMSGKVASEKELKNRFGVKILGVLPIEEKKWVFSGVDRWLDKMEGKNLQLSRETAYQVISANIQNYAEETGKLLITGTVSDEQLSELTSQLKETLPGYEVQVAGNMLVQASTLKKLPQCDGVILVEMRKKSTYAVIEQELETVKNVGKDVVGVVVL